MLMAALCKHSHYFYSNCTACFLPQCGAKGLERESWKLRSISLLQLRYHIHLQNRKVWPRYTEAHKYEHVNACVWQVEQVGNSFFYLLQCTRELAEGWRLSLNFLSCLLLMKMGSSQFHYDPRADHIWLIRDLPRVELINSLSPLHCSKVARG